MVSNEKWLLRIHKNYKLELLVMCCAIQREIIRSKYFPDHITKTLK